MASKFNSASDMKKARGLGSAKSGVHHWWMQRVTAGGTMLLLVWFVASLVLLPSLDYGTVTGWLSSPFVAVPMLLLILSAFWHARLGVQVMLEDYVHSESGKLFSFLALNFFIFAVAAVAAFSVLILAFGGARA